MKRKLGSALLAVLLLFGLLGPFPAFSADLLVTNYSFENGLTGWTQKYGSGGITASTAQSHTGASSVQIVDGSSSTPYGIESNYISASPNQVYMVYAWGYITSGSADVYLRFWDSNKNLIGSAYGSKATPLNEWTYFKIKATAPPNTAYVTALLYSNIANTGTIYFDDVYITKDYTDLGVQVTNAVAHGYTFGSGSNADKAYLVLDGAAGINAKLAVIDLNTETMLNSFTLPGATGGWAATTASDGNIYVGTYNNGHVYKHVPGSSSVTDLGQALPGISFVYGLSPGTNGKVYGGTYPDAKFFKYEPSSGFTQIGSTPIWGSEEYVRDTAYDASNNVTYLGIGAHAHLVRFDNTTGAKVDILPSQYAGEDFVYTVNFEGGKVFAKVTPSNTLLVLDVQETGGNVVTTVDAEVPGVGSLGVSPLNDGKVYFTVGGELKSYDLASKTVSSLPNATVGFSPSKLGIVQLADQTNYPGKTVIGLGVVLGKVRMFKYNIQTGKLHTADLNLPEVPNDISEIGTGPDGKIYSSGYLNGGTGVYSPLRDDQDVQYKGVGQAESMFALNGKMYFATYPSARLHEYDPMQPWVAGTNPRQLFSLGADQQDRPVTMDGGDGKLFIGTVPDYGHLGGALTVFDQASGTHTVYRNIVPDQSITAVAYKNGKVYGGSSIYGGLGSTPTATNAKFFVFDVATGTTTQYSLPVSGIDAITAAIVGPDDKIWGMADGYLFVFNPATNTFEYFQEKFSDITVTKWEDAYLVVGKFGDIYGTAGGKLFKVDPSTKAVTILLSSGATGLTEDVFGNLYYYNGTNLKRYAY